MFDIIGAYLCQRLTGLQITYACLHQYGHTFSTIKNKNILISLQPASMFPMLRGWVEGQEGAWVCCLFVLG